MEGGCYCGALRYKSSGKPLFKAQCHCRECQYFSGGGPNYFMLVPKAGFRWTSGKPKSFTRSDLAEPVTREFCAACGTHILTTRLDQPDAVVLKAGTLDAPEAEYRGPKAAIFTCDLQAFHHIPDELPSFERMPKG